MKARYLSVIFFLMAVYSFTQLYFYFDDLDFTHELFNSLIILLTLVIGVIMVVTYLSVYISKKRRFVNRK